MIQVIRDIGTVLIAVIVVLTLALIILYDTVNGKPFNIPAELYAIATLVVGFFFGQHATANGAASSRLTAAATAAQIAAQTSAAAPQSPTQ